ncbi:MAG: hypothetical protein A2527_05000 [Candidatus Lambdaproteobacteria bacterium RIFOXYD2_FULL_50_16]|uniref:Endolytic peptidoglycan transglycosylase RlpA n=1 Tax=Candidatus Lambdaproteobacteria bacterium RIFOXYD2_FULL_50_16 TaxID=1817772 RepID=A0A1F6G833_9PROT|nr:MAG: hypothetical protein A2527_05000 [Candidatus Lambdaproteobacteria bacterium RIFOXYD2_FULL_50_16]
MKPHNLFLALALAGLSACSTAKPEKTAFYTPGEFKEPAQSQAFFPKSKNYGTHPGTESTKPMEAPKGFVPQWEGAPVVTTRGEDNLDADQTYEYSPDFGDSDEALAEGNGEQMLGHASWYGPGFHGKKTANGERYNQSGMTAAHKLLPMGTWVRVTNQENGKSVVVRVNDRGPYKKNRIIDLTHTAAQRLSFDKKGTASVKLEVVRYPKGYDAKKGLTPYKEVVVQVAVFKDAGVADRFKAKLAAKYGEVNFMVDRQEAIFAVVAGPYRQREDAVEVSKDLKASGVDNFVRSLRK